MINKTYQLIQFRESLLGHKVIGEEQVGLVLEVQWIEPLIEGVVHPTVDVWSGGPDGIHQITCRQDLGYLLLRKKE